ncbi:MAG: fibronectin-binding domain-containing protein [Methanosarcinales archaeon]|nr:MAG: fibronectin-binding domain-containing protein [Methanosarcinales archaeon]
MTFHARQQPKVDISSIDTVVVASELSNLIVGAKIGKIYQHSPDEIRIVLRVTGTGRRDLVIEAGRRIHLTKYPKESEKVPQPFPMLLRKHLTGGRITKIEQYDFDRIIKIGIERAGVKTVLLCEFFARGNIVLLNEENHIILPLKSINYKDRAIRGGQIYELPPPQLNPQTVTVEELAGIFAASNTDVVRTLATRLNLGGMLSEEVCLLASIDKSTSATKISYEYCENIYSALLDLMLPLSANKFVPQVVKQDGVNIDVIPFELKQYKDFEKIYFSSINDALDEYYGKSEIKKIITPQKTRQGLYVRRLAQQETSLEKFNKEEEKLTSTGELLYAEYCLINDILTTIRGARGKDYSWEYIKKTLANTSVPTASVIERIDSSTGKITVNINGVRINLDYRLSVEQNAAAYYKRAKKFSSKINGAIKAISKTRELISKKETVDVVTKKKLKRKKPKWYEQFKWFYSTDGFLVIAGRDSDTNETVVKKYMEKRDLFFHTQYPGSPAVIVKTEGKNMPETTLKEAAQFTVSHSSVWKSGYAEGECYFVLPEQVSKTPEHGEFLPKGSFIIRGKRNYMKAAVGIAVGINNEKCLCGPNDAVRNRVDTMVELEPGAFNGNDMSTKIYRIFAEQAKDVRSLKMYASPEIISRCMPPGGSQIKSLKP